MPRELRQLRNETSTNVQGNIILKVEVFPVAFARANPMEHLAPPKKTQARTGGNHRPYPQLPPPPLPPPPPPPPAQFEMRVVIWEAKDVATKDGNQSDVFITIQPRGEAEYLTLTLALTLTLTLTLTLPGEAEYEKQSTDTHWFSTGDAEFNWRMIWPIFLPEKVPRLFIQVRRPSPSPYPSPSPSP